MKASQRQCVNCQLQFDLEEEYLAHYRSEHHRYNIKRKLIGLQPLSLNEYCLRTCVSMQNFKRTEVQSIVLPRSSTAKSAQRSS